MWISKHVGVHECVCMYRRRSNKRIPFRGCDPLQSLLSTPKNKQTPEFFFKYVNDCEFEVQHTVDYIAGGKEISRYNQNIRSDYLAIALSALKCLKSLSV